MPTAQERFIVIHELSGTQDGPFTRGQVNQLILQRKIKRNSKIEVVGRDGLYSAKDLFGNAFEAAKQRNAEVAEQVKKEKQKAKEEKQAAKEEMKLAKQAEKANADQSSKTSSVWKSPLSGTQRGGTESADRFVDMCDQFISLIRIVGWISVVITIGISILPFIVLGQENPINYLYALGCLVVFAAVGYMLIELSVLALRFMRETVQLLALPLR